MEVLLPVALKVFPNMLPSTFEDKLKVIFSSNICSSTGSPAESLAFHTPMLLTNGQSFCTQSSEADDS